MDKVRDDLNNKRADELRKHSTSFPGLLIGSAGPDGGMAAMDSYQDSLKITGKWNAKTTTSNNNAVEASWDISGGKIPAGKYSVYIDVSMSNASHSNRYFFNQNKTVNPKNPATGEDYPDDPATNGNEDKETESKWRYYVSLNGGAIIEPDQGKSWGDLGLNGGSNAATKYVCLNTEITIGADATKFSAWHGDIGYSLVVAHVRLVEIKAAA